MQIGLKNKVCTIAVLLVVFSPGIVYSQNDITNTQVIIDPVKINSYQVATYKPKAANNGANGDNDFKLFGGLITNKNGSKGKKGRKGPDLVVKVSSINKGDSTIIKVTIQVAGENREPDIYFINPRYGKILISADGGDGGNGGMGMPYGTDGKGGVGGNGGRIDVLFESSDDLLINCKCLLFSNLGGLGGGKGTKYKYDAESGSPGPPVIFKDIQGNTIIVKE